MEETATGYINIRIVLQNADRKEEWGGVGREKNQKNLLLLRPDHLGNVHHWRATAENASYQ
jgi:hypothetical protein